MTNAANSGKPCLQNGTGGAKIEQTIKYQSLSSGKLTHTLHTGSDIDTDTDSILGTP